MGHQDWRDASRAIDTYFRQGAWAWSGVTTLEDRQVTCACVLSGGETSDRSGSFFRRDAGGDASQVIGKDSYGICDLWIRGLREVRFVKRSTGRCMGYAVVQSYAAEKVKASGCVM